MGYLQNSIAPKWNTVSSFPSLERVTFVLQGFGKHTCSIMQSPLRVSGSSNGKSKKNVPGYARISTLICRSKKGARRS